MANDIEIRVPFTLDLSQSVIRLLYDFNGAPTVLGDVTLVDRTLPDQMRHLRSLAHRLSGDPLLSTIIVPTEHVMFCNLPKPTQSIDPFELAAAFVSQDRQLDPDELCIDAFKQDGKFYFAAIEKKTLLEALEFAQTHGFMPTRFTSHPPRNGFPRPPIFQLNELPLKLDKNWQYETADISNFNDTVTPATDGYG